MSQDRENICAHSKTAWISGTVDVENENGPKKPILQPTEPMLLDSNINNEDVYTIDWASPFNQSSSQSFFGLSEKVHLLFKTCKGIEKLYDWQEECLALPAVTLRQNLIYSLPTSGGKTLVAEVLMIKEVLRREKSCLFDLPYVSIVQEKVADLSPFALELNFLVEEYTAGKGQLPPYRRCGKQSVYIATVEKGSALLDSLIESGRIAEIGLVVVDELHTIAEVGRGAFLESLLTKAMFVDAAIQIVAMSATIGNLNEIATFLNAEVYTRDFRPIELKEFFKCGRDIMTAQSHPTSSEKQFCHIRTIDVDTCEETQKIDPDQLGHLVSEVVPRHSCLVFCASKQSCENVASVLSRVLPNTYTEQRQQQRSALRESLRSRFGKLCPILSATVLCGVAYHHSGLSSGQRHNLEGAFRDNLISVLCCTTTLAAGVNLPAKRMIGRGGRAGLAECGESITIFQPKDCRRMLELLNSPLNEVNTTLHLDEGKGLKTLILSTVGLRLATSRPALYSLISKTLLAVQTQRFKIDLEQLIDRTLNDLFGLKALTTPATTNHTSPSRSDIHRFEDSFELTVNDIGRASFKSSIDLEKCVLLYDDLQKIQRRFVLLDALHLLYMVTPYEPADVNVEIDMKVYYTQYSRLTAVQRTTAEALGITEGCAVNMVTGQSFKPNMCRVVHRFFFTLILNELWQGSTNDYISEMYHVKAGVVEKLASATATHANHVIRFCKEFQEFWPCKVLIEGMLPKLYYFSQQELCSLMELPAVKLSRARQLSDNGFRNLEDVAKATPQQLVDKIPHVMYKVANKIISSAKVLLLRRLEQLQRDVDECMDGLSRDGELEDEDVI